MMYYGPTLVYEDSYILGTVMDVGVRSGAKKNGSRTKYSGLESQSKIFVCGVSQLVKASSLMQNVSVSILGRVKNILNHFGYF